ncbi:MAG: hypothetical protein C0599_08880 [Salinivirgaceae bacterium]|nr:MAG: hypothetical protein C0599_08880 [Salinivirgaceae bacterium]
MCGCEHEGILDIGYWMVDGGLNIRSGILDLGLGIYILDTTLHSLCKEGTKRNKFLRAQSEPNRKVYIKFWNLVSGIWTIEFP